MQAFCLEVRTCDFVYLQIHFFVYKAYVLHYFQQHIMFLKYYIVASNIITLFIHTSEQDQSWNPKDELVNL